MTTIWTPLSEALAARAARGRQTRFWLRDDDAVEPTPHLDRLLRLAGSHMVPLTLAVIPEHTGMALADRLSGEQGVSVAVHGWSHANHAPANEKKQELGRHRPADEVLGELAAGIAHLKALHPQRFVPMLVPPWNRIDKSLYSEIGKLGFRAISVFGDEKPSSPPEFNTHVDVMDWHGSRGCRPHETLIGEIIARLAKSDTIGILTHHLVHDEGVHIFLTQLFDVTVKAHNCRWIDVRSEVGEPASR